MMFRRKEVKPDSFWQEYEENTGEKVLARSLGRYICGLEEFDSRKWTDIWGLFIVTSGGFRFHHFPQYSWFDSMISITGQAKPKEKTFLIPMEKIISVRFNKEARWWKKILSSSPPQLNIHFLDDTGNECRLLLEAEFKSDELVETLCREIQKK